MGLRGDDMGAREVTAQHECARIGCTRLTSEQECDIHAVEPPITIKRRSKPGPRQRGQTLRVWVCVDFEGFYPVGSAAVVVAKDEETARTKLREALEDHGLGDQDEFKLTEVLVDVPGAIILVDGNY